MPDGVHVNPLRPGPGAVRRYHAPLDQASRGGGRRRRVGRTAIDHRLIEPDDDAFATEYTRWTRQNKRNRPGRYRFVLAAAWNTRTLADGRYVVEVAASDVSGNTSVTRFAIRIANRTTPV